MRVRRQAPLTRSLKLLVFICLFIFSSVLYSKVLDSYSPTTTFLFSTVTLSIFLFFCSLGAHFLGIRRHCSLPPFFFLPFFFLFLISAFLLFTVFVSVCPGADKLNLHTLFSFDTKQALCATTARLRVPCTVLPWSPIRILCTKGNRICENPTALNDWNGHAPLVTYLV